MTLDNEIGTNELGIAEYILSEIKLEIIQDNSWLIAHCKMI